MSPSTAPSPLDWRIAARSGSTSAWISALALAIAAAEAAATASANSCDSVMDFAILPSDSVVARGELLRELIRADNDQRRRNRPGRVIRGARDHAIEADKPGTHVVGERRLELELRQDRVRRQIGGRDRPGRDDRVPSPGLII